MANILKYKGYHGSIEFSAEDNMLIGSVIGIQDSLNFHGHSIEEITQSFHDCIDGYLEMCAAFGRSPDKVYKGSFNIRIPQDLHRQAAIMAETEGISLNQFIQQAIEERVKPVRYKNILIHLPTIQTAASVKSSCSTFNQTKYHASPSVRFS